MQVERNSQRNSDKHYPQATPVVENGPAAALVVLRDAQNYAELATHIMRTEKLQQVVESADPSIIQPETLGALALAYLQDALKVNLSALEQLCILRSGDLLGNLERGTTDIQVYTMLLLNLILEEDTVHLKEHLIQLRCFGALLSLIRQDHPTLSRLALELAAKIYRGDLTAQSGFLACRGHYAFVELAIRRSGDEEFLAELMNHVLDLVLVNYMQDAENYLVHENAVQVKATKLMGALSRIDLTAVGLT